MIIYLDLVIIINFIFDFLLLLTVNITLKRYSKIYKLILATLFGNITIISLFIPINSIFLIILKVILGIIMVIIAFGYKNFLYTFYNIIYLYMTSIILGGFLYYLKNELGSKIYYDKISINYLVFLVLGPFILYLFIKSMKALKTIHNYYYKVKIIINNYTLNIIGFLDTGNKLKDPITNKPIIIINKKLLPSNINIRSPMYVPIHTLNSHSLMVCLKPNKIYINNQELKNYLIGISLNTIKLNGIDCLLNYYMLEDIHD